MYLYYITNPITCLVVYHNNNICLVISTYIKLVRCFSMVIYPHAGMLVSILFLYFKIYILYINTKYYNRNNQTVRTIHEYQHHIYII